MTIVVEVLAFSSNMRMVYLYTISMAFAINTCKIIKVHSKNRKVCGLS